ncbi:MAG: metallophosphoesterase [Isosphaerales bacterium]
MRIRRGSIVASWLLALASTLVSSDDLATGLLWPSAKASEVVFLVKPYLQLGDAPPGQVATDLGLLWHTDLVETDWAVEYRPGPGAAWREAGAPRVRGIAVPSIAPHWVYHAALNGLGAGDTFAYRVRKGGKVVFSAEGRAPKRAGQSYRFVAFGDCGAGTAAQKAVAYQAYLARPDFVMITGDIVYSRGRISEYREKFWTVYNADQASPLLGAPLLRSTLFLAAPGNHDIATRDLEKYPDGLAYFLYWDQPRNGPPDNGGGVLAPPLTGPATNRQAFLAASAGTYPRMANFSFEYGNAHWLILDSNPYVDWTNREIRTWVERDLAAARNATWRFVAFHHPGFHSSKAHFDAQQMRLLADLFETGRVDVVFSGHVHNYQRTLPLRFNVERDRDGKLVRDRDRVPGRWTLDTLFDGQTRTRPQGVIYVVTGAGGNTLYNPEQQDDPRSWQPFTQRFISKTHSLTVADVDDATLTVRQVSVEGQELDRFVVTK